MSCMQRKPLTLLFPFFVFYVGKGSSFFPNAKWNIRAKNIDNLMVCSKRLSMRHFCHTMTAKTVILQLLMLMCGM